MEFHFTTPTGETVGYHLVLALYVRDNEIWARLNGRSDQLFKAYASEQDAIADIQDQSNIVFRRPTTIVAIENQPIDVNVVNGGSGGGDGDRVVVSSGLLDAEGGMISDEVSVPANAQEILMSVAYSGGKDMTYTTDGITIPSNHLGVRGGKKSAVAVLGNELIKNLRVYVGSGKKVYYEMYNVSGASRISGDD